MVPGDENVTNSNIIAQHLDPGNDEIFAITNNGPCDINDSNTNRKGIEKNQSLFPSSGLNIPALLAGNSRSDFVLPETKPLIIELPSVSELPPLTNSLPTIYLESLVRHPSKSEK